MKYYVSIKLILTAILMVSVILGHFSPAIAYGKNKQSLAYEQVEETLRPYVTVTDDEVFFDRERALADDLGEEPLLVGETLNKLNNAYGTKDETKVSALKISLPIWGNWCGPGYGGGEPQNLLDQGCMQHDLCYDKKGYLDCTCDEALIDHIDRYASKMGFLEKATAYAVKFYFSVAPCTPHADFS
ncbi:hypothetical protein NSQ26_07950 [Bacillus sp. FSL W7-1360]